MNFYPFHFNLDAISATDEEIRLPHPGIFSRLPECPNYICDLRPLFTFPFSWLKALLREDLGRFARILIAVTGGGGVISRAEISYHGSIKVSALSTF